MNRWLYTLYLAIDANFRLKLKERGIKQDVDLGAGWAYFVNDRLYREELVKHTDFIEVRAMSTPMFAFANHLCSQKNSCQSTHQAIARATSRVNKGYRVTGVGAVICSRSGIVRGNGVVDLQRGERYVTLYTGLLLVVDFAP